MKNYVIDETLLPEIWMTWMSKEGRIWMDNEGVRYKRPQSWMRYDGEHNINSGHYRSDDGRIPCGINWATRNSERLWVSSGTQVYYAYAKYHPDIDRLELVAVKYDTTRGEGKHTWSYAGDRLFVGKDKSIVDENGIAQSGWYTVKKGSSYRYGRDAFMCITRLNTHKDSFMTEFKKFIGGNYFVIGNGASEFIEYLWHLNKWYDSVQKKRTTGKSQKLVDELVAMPLGEIGHLAYKYPPKHRENAGYWESKTIDNIIYFERVNDKWSVLRALIRNDNGGLDEGWRVYLGDDGTNRITTNSNGEWIPSTHSKSWYFNHNYYFANEDEALEKCNRIKYISPIMKPTDGISVLITTLKFPCIEQLYKMGQKTLAHHIACSNQPKAYMKEVFGFYNAKEKSVLRQIGMNKHQLDAYCAKRDEDNHRWGWSIEVISKLREALGNDLSHTDNATFDKYLDAFAVIFNDFWGTRYVSQLNVDKSRFWKNIVRLNDKYPGAARLISDTLGAYNRLRGDIEVDWFFDDYSDIVRTHDALTALVNEQEAERRAYYDMAEAERRKKDDEKRKKTDEKRKCYEYEDDNFVIRLPKDIYEIIREGSRQSICIGGYTQRHSNGDTNLFFLRRKNDEDTPFYAIEMNNNKHIVQIHGSCNKWLGNNPEAIPTVVRWLRKHDIKCDKTILTCTARGYGSTNEYIEMPIVD